MAMAASDGPDDVREDDGPLRTCVVTRRQEPIENLIRFVAAPDGSIVPDLACKLPGRGVWVDLDRKAVEAAVRTKAFNRGLKRQVTAADGLADLVDRLLMQRMTGALALANKAGLVLTGFEKLDKAIIAGTPIALLHGRDAAPDGVGKLDRRFAAMSRDLGRPPQFVTHFTIEEMSLALGRANVVHAALMMGGAAKSFLSEAGRLERYRTGRLDVEQAATAAERLPPTDLTEHRQA